MRNDYGFAPAKLTRLDARYIAPLTKFVQGRGCETVWVRYSCGQSHRR